jgi:hypothetical protein
METSLCRYADTFLRAPHADTFRCYAETPYAVTPLRSAAAARRRVNVVLLPGLLAMSIVPE